MIQVKIIREFFTEIESPKEVFLDEVIVVKATTYNYFNHSVRVRLDIFEFLKIFYKFLNFFLSLKDSHCDLKKQKCFDHLLTTCSNSQFLILFNLLTLFSMNENKIF